MAGANVLLGIGSVASRTRIALNENATDESLVRLFSAVVNRLFEPGSAFVALLSIHTSLPYLLTDRTSRK
jgi:hypothetical protein